MRLFHSCLLMVACIGSFVTRARSEEPPKGDAGQSQQALVESYTALTSDALLLRHPLVDVSTYLVAEPNGLGIDVALPDVALRAQLGLKENAGLVVTAARKGSSGAKAGLQTHDVIVKVGDSDVGEAAKLQELLAGAEGQKIKLVVRRQGKAVELEATPRNPLAHRAALNFLWKDVLVNANEEHYRIGVTLSEADDTLRSHLRLATGEGLVVTEVVGQGAAEGAGVKVHDVLIVLDGKRLTTVEAINAQIQEIKEKEVELRLLRSGREAAVRLAPRKTSEARYTDTVVRLWDTNSCRNCHGAAHDAHQHLGAKLGMTYGAWYAGQRFLFQDAKQGQPTSSPTSTQAQLATLKNQLSEMQKTLGALEAALAPASDEKPAEEKKE